MRLVRTLDEFFIGNDEGTATDRIWAIGQYVVYFGITALTIISIY